MLSAMFADSATASSPSTLHRITVHTASCIAWLDDLRCAHAVAAELIRCDQEASVESLAWVVLPTRVLWLLRRDESCLNRVMAGFKDRSARAVQCTAERSARIWQAGYHEQRVVPDDIESFARDLITLPVREGLAERPGQYPHCYCAPSLAIEWIAELPDSNERRFLTTEAVER